MIGPLDAFTNVLRTMGMNSLSMGGPTPTPANPTDATLAYLQQIAGGKGGSVNPFTAPATPSTSGSTQALANTLFSGSPSSSGTPSAGTSGRYVWMGDRTKNPDYQMKPKSPLQQAMQGPGDGQGYGVLAPPGPGGRVPVSYSQVLNLPYTWNEKQRQANYARLSAATGTQITNFSQFTNAWTNAVQAAEASWFATQGGKNGSPLTPWDVIDLAKREGDNTLLGIAATPKSAVAHDITQTQSTVNTLSDGGAWQLIKSATQSALGRAPTHDEVRQFAARANTIAVNNPTTQVDNTHVSAGGAASSTSRTVHNGAGVDDFNKAADAQTVNTPEAGAYQAATTYFNAMLAGLNAV